MGIELEIEASQDLRVPESPSAHHRKKIANPSNLLFDTALLVLLC